ncbi:hypothetical protein F4861DRAFT_487942 [Xylaria intraflava]|nr:hypothetical protein F4861DRAFT_487942 [Xylaria intraflava]
MSGGRIVVDGLWRCLCPSIDPAHLYKPFELWRLPRRQPGTPFAPRSRSSQYPQQRRRRQYSQFAVPYERRHKQNVASEKSRSAYMRRLAWRNPWIPKALFKDLDSADDKLDNIPTRIIYAGLKELQSSEETYLLIARLTEYLIKERGERPNTALYESLIKANISHKYGSAKVAGKLLKEMKSQDIPTTPEIYQALLEVTAVHPDYVLRAQVLHDMKNRWFGLTPSSNISIIIGLLRDGQYEHALLKLEELNKIPINVPPWLLDLFLYTFGELGFHEETLSILKHRQEIVDTMKRDALSLNAWQFLLEVFSRDLFLPGIKYIWDHSVAPGSIHPPDGVLWNVLNTASIHGDTTLAMSVVQVLSARGTKLDIHHYEALIQTYVHHGDLRKALTVLCIMAKAGLSLDLASTRPIFPLLNNSPTATEQALNILHELKVQYTIPVAAFNLVLESTASHGGFKTAFDLYRIVRQICINGPDLETFDILLRYCTQRKSMSFLVAEMEAFSLKPSRAIFDHLIRISTMQDDYEMAFRYLEVMRMSAPPEWWISKDSALALLRRCIQARDSRYEIILEECRRRRLLHENDIKSLVSIEANAGVAQGPPSSNSLTQKSPESTRQLILNSVATSKLMSR